MLRSSLIIALLFASSAAWGYIPEYAMIMSRVAENHGRGLYQIEQEVSLRADPEPLVFKETWLILNETSMRVTVEGLGPLRGLLHGSIVYDNGQKFSIDHQGQLRQSRVPDEFIETLFHFRFSKNIKPKLVALKMAPGESLKERASLPTGDNFKYDPQSFIRLSRTGGAVSWAITPSSRVDAGERSPGIWIEQDQFVIRKFRFNSMATVTADQYSRYPDGLWLPKVRQISWNDQSGQIQLLSVKSLGRPKSMDFLKPSSLTGKKSATSLNLPTQNAVLDFYTRFR